MDPEVLLQKIETLELDRDLATVFPSAPPNVTRSIDAAARLIEASFPVGGGRAGIC
jgi:hypothetical protein